MPNRTAFERALIDTIGVGVAGRVTEEVTRLRRWSDGHRAPGPATSWLDGAAITASGAALENAYAAHVLDLDDVSSATRMHPSVVLIPALLASGEQRRASGRQMLAAYDVGAAVFRAVACVLPAESHYQAGWHTTATVGLLAATCALCSLRHLSPDQTAHALGLCGSLASGSVRNFGSMAKALQVARASSDAVMAIELVEAGFTANPRQLDEPDGYFGMYGSYDEDRIAGLAEQLQYWSTEWPQDIAVKRYPSCYATHKILDAAQQLRAAAGLDPHDVEAIDITVEPAGLDPLIAHYPGTGLEGKFSAGYVLGALLHDGSVSLSSFTDAAVRRGELKDFAARVSLRESERPSVGAAEWSEGYAAVRIRLRDGSSLESRRDHTIGHAKDPISAADLHEKFRDCLRAGGLGQLADPLYALLLDVDAVEDVTEVTAWLRHGSERRPGDLELLERSQ